MPHVCHMYCEEEGAIHVEEERAAHVEEEGANTNMDDRSNDTRNNEEVSQGVYNL